MWRGAWGIASILVLITACGSQPSLPEPILELSDGGGGIVRVRALADSLVVTGFGVTMEIGHDGQPLDRGLPMVSDSLASAGGWTAFYVKEGPTLGRRAPDGTIDRFDLPADWRDHFVSVIAAPDGTVWLERSGVDSSIWKLASGALTRVALDYSKVRIRSADASYLYSSEVRGVESAIVRYPVAGGEGEVVLRGQIALFLIEDDRLVYVSNGEVRILSLSSRNEVVVGVPPVTYYLSTDLLALSGDAVIAGPYRLQDGTATLLLPEPRIAAVHGDAFVEQIMSVAAADGLVFWTIGYGPTRVYAYPVDAPPIGAPNGTTDEVPPFL